jgi:hypothetical protein
VALLVIVPTAVADAGTRWASWQHGVLASGSRQLADIVLLGFGASQTLCDNSVTNQVVLTTIER